MEDVTIAFEENSVDSVSYEVHPPQTDQSKEDLDAFRELCLGTQLTGRIPGSAARVWDNDGEFLLIEAAYSLPRWLKPETSTNRVWIAGGKLHIVPLPSAATPSIPSFPTLTQALQLVRSEHVPTLAGSKAQAAIQARMGEFQQGRHKHMHRSRVIVPTQVAAVLAAEPQLIAPAVEAFHYRDVDDMRAAARMQHFPPQDMANVVVTFSRCLYAQLEHQQFEPPKGYTLPSPESQTFRAAQLGMKLTCGFEMLYSGREHHAGAGAQEEENGAHAQSAAGTASSTSRINEANGGSAVKALSKDQVAGNPSWQVYKSSLERNGYFKGNIPGSQQHLELMQAALQSFAASEAYKRSSAALAAPILRMQDILRQPPRREQLEKDMQGAEDDDSWMRDGADVLEKELAARQTEMKASASDQLPNADFDPEHLAERMKAFVEKESSFEGAELPAAASRPSRAAGAAAASQAASRPGASSAFVRSPAARPAEGMPLEDDQRWETLTATDSDDDEAAGDADFLTEYEERMERELGRSKVGATFERGPAGPTPAAGSAGAKGKGKAAVVEDMGDAPGFVGGQGTRARVGKVEEGEEEEELRPVDIDLNLVQNLLASYSGQQGLPGPASNLVGLLGLHLPDDEDSRGKSAFDSFMS
ncbi:hypothetical protein WJX75_006178 [Coccomyxa subellipsoidea]|uniref:SGT1-domain-containing protein n=1 Tax=Coccomyxa subellipsoidea TaxID=248742 RepID=A0ABR2YPR2_9CHLO